MGAFYFFVDNLSHEIASDNLSLGIWQFSEVR